MALLTFGDTFDILRGIKGDDTVLDSKEIHGIDVSNWQRQIDWDKAKATQHFFYIKATEGEDYRSATFDRHTEGAISTGLPFGYYHFATPKPTDAEGEARDFLAALDKYRANWNLPPVLDLEQNKHNMSHAEMEDWCQRFIRVLEEELQRPVMIYGSPGLLHSYLGNDHSLGKQPVWVAHYSVASPRTPAGWNKIDVWQYADKGYPVDGVGRDVDVNKAKLRFFYEYLRANG